MVKQTNWKGRHKIQDRWEDKEYQVVDQPTPGVPVYAVKSIAGGRPRVLHRNLLLPLQGRFRQEGRVGEEGSSDSESEDEMPEVARTPHRRSRRTTKPQVNSTQQVDTPAALPKDTHSELSSPSSPEHMSGDEDSSEGEEYATPLTSDTPAAIPPSTAGAVQKDESHDRHSTIGQLTLKCPILKDPYNLIRQPIVCPVNKIATLSPMIMNKIPKVLCHQPQEEVPGAPKAYLLCAMERSIYTAQ